METLVGVLKLLVTGADFVGLRIKLKSDTEFLIVGFGLLVGLDLAELEPPLIMG